LFVTTKIWNDRQGYASSLEAIDEALEKLNIEYIDMLLIHWPVPKQDKYVETWQAFEHALASGRIKGIGVSNFEPEHLTKLMAAATVTPALNQVELHPGLQQAEVRSFDAANGIATEAWSPLARGRFSDNPVLLALADKHGKTVTQVIVRWHIQIGNLVIPKTSHPDRLAENIDVFDFELDATDLAQVATLEANFRTGAHPNNL
jgi:2,5-diketo-D-gluconate reductase A